MEDHIQLPQREQAYDDPSLSSSHPLLSCNERETHSGSNGGAGGDDLEAPPFNSEVHLAAERGDVEELRTLLSNGHPLTTNFKNRTPLHYACEVSDEDKALEMADIILDNEWETTEKLDLKHELIDYQDFQGDTALHLAARMGHAKLAKKLLFLAADVNLKNKMGVEPVHLIFDKVPSALLAVFSAALKFNPGEPNEENSIVRLDSGAIVGYPDAKDGNLSMETEMLTYCLRQSELSRLQIMLHPAVHLFMILKWRRFRMLTWITTLFHIIWLLLLIHFIWDVYRVQCPYENVRLADCHLQLGSRSLFSLHLQAGFILAMQSLLIVKEIHDIFYSKLGIKYYCWQLGNISKWLLMTLTVFVIIPILTSSHDTLTLKPWMYQSTHFVFLLSCALIAEQLVNLLDFAVPKMVSEYVLIWVRSYTIIILILMVLVTQISKLKPEDLDRITHNFSSDYSIRVTSSPLIFYNIIVYIVILNIQIMASGGLEGFFERHVPSNLLSCQLEEMYLMEKLILSKRLHALLGYFGRKHWLLRFLIAQQNDTDLRMAVDVKVSDIPKPLRKQVKFLAARNSQSEEAAA